EDRGDGRALRGERRAAQLLRPSLLDDRRAFLRRRAELSRDGNRHRQRALARRTGDASAGVREWRADPADAPRLGDGHQRGGCARASGEGVGRTHMKTVLAGFALIGAVLAAPALAQAPAAAVPEAMPFDIPYGEPIGLDQAKQV